MTQFTNATIHIEELPRAEEVTLQAISKKYLKLLRVEWLLTTVILVIGTAALLAFSSKLHGRPIMYLLPAGVAVFFILYFLWQEKTFPYRAYAVRERDVLYQRGWIIPRLKVCPFNRIQNCTVQQGPLERRWKLATLTLFTAGSNGADMRIAGLNHTEALQLQQAILTRINAHASNG